MAYAQSNETCSDCENICDIGFAINGTLSSLEIENPSVTPTKGLPGEEFIITADVTDIVPTTTVTASLRNWNDTVVAILALYDDGLHYDGDGSDSEYGNMVNSSELFDGTYKIDITAISSIGQQKQVIDAAEFEIASVALRDESKYNERSAFLVSDRDWHDVLPLVPVTTWTDNDTVHKYPTLLFHEENIPGKVIDLNEEEFVSETGLQVSWTFVNNTLAEGDVGSDPFIITFDLTDEQYDMMQRAIPRADVRFDVTEVDPTWPNNRGFGITYTFNGEQRSESVYKKNGEYVLQGAFWGLDERTKIKRTNNTMVLPRSQGNQITVNGFRLYVPYFATDIIYDSCEPSTDPHDIFQLCIEGANVQQTQAAPGDTVTYTIDVRNIVDEPVDLSDTLYRIGGLWTHPEDSLGDLYKVPYSLVMSHVDTQIPPIVLQPGESTSFTITLSYDKADNIEEYSYDADSTIYFFQKYGPDDLTIIGDTPEELDGLLVASPGLGAGIPQQSITKVGTDDLMSYWLSYKDVVYVQDDYDLALLAASYASLINAPLVIEGTSMDTPNVFSGKKVICVGAVTPSASGCMEQYGKDSLQAAYLDMTDTDKAILLNPDDLGIYKSATFTPVKSSTRFTNLYTRTSLIAPFLAGAKHELILSTPGTTYQEFDGYWKGRIAALDWDPYYLTVIAAPNAIPYKEYMGQLGSYANYRSLDHTQYASFDSDHHPEKAAGRIYGISSADSSGLVMRTLFFDEMTDKDGTMMMATGDPDEPWYYYVVDDATRWTAALSSAGYDAVAETRTSHQYSFSPSYWSGRNFIAYMDHGSESWAGISSSSIPLLEHSVIFNDACSTCASWDANSFCTRAVRQGATAHMGGVGIAYTNNRIYMNTMNGIYYENQTIGQSFQEGWGWISTYSMKYRYMTLLLGDPTFEMNPPHYLSSPLTW